MKAFQFTYSQMCPEWLAQNILNRTAAVKDWVQPFPNSAIVVSDLQCQELAAVLRSHLGDTWFLVTEVTGRSTDGWLPKNLWQFVNSPHTASLVPPPVPEQMMPPKVSAA